MIENAIKKPNWIKRIVIAIIGVPVGGFLLLLILATLFPFEKKPGDPVVSYYELQRLTEDAIRASMNDPASTQFRNVRQGPTPDVICGEVNARNAFGGYAPFARFYARSTPSPITPQLEIEPVLAKSRAEAVSFESNYHSNCGPT